MIQQKEWGVLQMAKKRDILSFDLVSNERRAKLNKLKEITGNTNDSSAMDRALNLGLKHLQFREMFDFDDKKE